ncbi:hypothetical protein U1Q18_014535 [Sarracenia purpurea var. burkii]
MIEGDQVNRGAGSLDPVADKSGDEGLEESVSVGEEEETVTTEAQRFSIASLLLPSKVGNKEVGKEVESEEGEDGSGIDEDAVSKEIEVDDFTPLIQVDASPLPLYQVCSDISKFDPYFDSNEIVLDVVGKEKREVPLGPVGVPPKIAKFDAFGGAHNVLDKMPKGAVAYGLNAIEGNLKPAFSVASATDCGEDGEGQTEILGLGSAEISLPNPILGIVAIDKPGSVGPIVTTGGAVANLVKEATSLEDNMEADGKILGEYLLWEEDDGRLTRPKASGFIFSLKILGG